VPTERLTRRAAALQAAATLTYGHGSPRQIARLVTEVADVFDAWLAIPAPAARLDPTADPPVDKPTGTPDGNGNSMLQIELPDTKDVTVHANPLDAEGFAATGDTITWTAADSTGAPTTAVTLTPSADTLSCYVASGAPTAGIALTLADSQGNTEVVTIDVLGGPAKSLAASADAPVDKPAAAPAA
jgi:dipeptidyl aminopeptidase/acylaminoacyl peptidase